MSETIFIYLNALIKTLTNIDGHSFRASLFLLTLDGATDVKVDRVVIFCI